MSELCPSPLQPNAEMTRRPTLDCCFSSLPSHCNVCIQRRFSSLWLVTARRWPPPTTAKWFKILLQDPMNLHWKAMGYAAFFKDPMNIYWKVMGEVDWDRPSAAARALARALALMRNVRIDGSITSIRKWWRMKAVNPQTRYLPETNAGISLPMRTFSCVMLAGFRSSSIVIVNTSSISSRLYCRSMFTKSSSPKNPTTGVTRVPVTATQFGSLPRMFDFGK
mmetsp:Transcript_68549/g.142924  ORF Transcript_68549/g.142924 Transcript_68549/m.142924 type:complete len:222 (-) Transcript_68549:833-1498(-)